MSGALSVVAIVAAYNEADIIELAVRDLIANGVQVYLIDDGSTDATARLIEPLVGRGVVGIERLASAPAPNSSGTFSLERLVRRKAQLAAELDADWFINHDADEFREAPWAGVSLAEGISRADALGYNAIDFLDLDFWPTTDCPEPGGDVRQSFLWYSDAAEFNRLQIRCWRKTPGIDLASSGGHDVQFKNRRVFPVRFISRHYPIRGQAHGQRKVFVERQPRYSSKERTRHWHVQYDGLQEGTSFVRDTCELTRYDGDAVRMSLVLHHRGVEALEASLAESQSALDVAKCATEVARADVQSAREEIARQTGQINELTRVVDRVSQESASYRDDNRQLRATLDSRALEIGETRAQLAHVQAALETRNGELSDLHTELAQVRTAAGELTRDNAGLQEEIVRRDHTIADVRTISSMRERELASQAVQLANARAGLEDVRGRLDAVHRSWSWKLMTPARALLRWMRGY